MVPGADKAAQAGCPLAHVELSRRTVVGLEAGGPALEPHSTLVLEVPHSADINPRIEPTRVSFQPQLRAASEAPRVIVPIWPTSVHGMPRTRGADKVSWRHVEAFRGLVAPWTAPYTLEQLRHAHRRWLHHVLWLRLAGMRNFLEAWHALPSLQLRQVLIIWHAAVRCRCPRRRARTCFRTAESLPPACLPARLPTPLT